MMINWLSTSLIKIIHKEQINEHGGLQGTRDNNLLESALMRPQNLHFYQNITDIAILGSTYTFAIVRNHPFIDGNKRTGFVAGVTFLLLNGYQFSCDNQEVVITIKKLASGSLSEKDLQHWFITWSNLDY
ncbi:death-on-curing family protein [Cyanobacterium stanieri PCC 7202]|uniref:Death-on-curing family protein n=1 Tax=Cyanobacterium stanieri (strain ATCC 29140 / PCC 7202) TaxID=292563 RepID=K9YJH1_CYASC|nr:death-on-curing family protein [Cyanobacterium stanieri PCC 7202]